MGHLAEARNVHSAAARSHSVSQVGSASVRLCSRALDALPAGGFQPGGSQSSGSRPARVTRPPVPLPAVSVWLVPRTSEQPDSVHTPFGFEGAVQSQPPPYERPISDKTRIVIEQNSEVESVTMGVRAQKLLLALSQAARRDWSLGTRLGVMLSVVKRDWVHEPFFCCC